MEQIRLTRFEQHHLKEKTEAALVDYLLKAIADQGEAAQGQLLSAYTLASQAHTPDRHKDTAYIYHPLRVANRIAHYLEATDLAVLQAAVLHDIVEDHAAEIVDGSLAVPSYDTLPPFGMMGDVSDYDRQALALAHIELSFSPRTAQLVAAVTNPPSSDRPVDYEAKIQAYVDKVRQAIHSPDGWLIKFSDWCDNGIGIIHDTAGQGDKTHHFRYKYGSVLPVLEARFYEDDIQSKLSDSARAYAIDRFTRGRERLTLAA